MRKDRWLKKRKDERMSGMREYKIEEG